MSTTNEDGQGYELGSDAKEGTLDSVTHEKMERKQDTGLQIASVATLVSDIMTIPVMNNTIERKGKEINAGRIASEKNQTVGGLNQQSMGEIKTNDGNGNGQDGYLSGWSLVLVTIGFLLGDFVAMLDQSMVATALPKLASQFNSLDQLTWVVSAFFLTEAGAILTLGQILTIVPSKWVFSICFVLFKIASLICALAPKLEVLIFGRTLQGVAVSGGLISVVTMIAQVARLEIRSLVFGSFAATNAISSVAGPMLGGILTDRLSWRWCFYINIPICAVSLLVVLVFVPVYPPLPNERLSNKSTFQKWLSLDWLGGFLSLAITTCFVLPLQWGGTQRAWNDKVIIALFCVSGALLPLFILWEKYRGDTAILPLHLLSRRTQLFGGISAFFILVAFIIATYYLPFYYQCKGSSASQSGINIIPYMMSLVAGILFSGFTISRTGRYWYNLIGGPVIAAVGAGLLFTIKEETTNANIIGYQILVGFGIGLAYQVPIVAMQGEYANEPELVPQAMSLLLFFQLLGGVCGIAIGGAVFSNRLTFFLSTQANAAASQLTPELIKQVRESVNVIFELPPPVRQAVISAYISALDYGFIVIVPACALISLTGLGVKNMSLKGDRKNEDYESASTGEEKDNAREQEVFPNTS